MILKWHKEGDLKPSDNAAPTTSAKPTGHGGSPGLVTTNYPLESEMELPSLFDLEAAL